MGRKKIRKQTIRKKTRRPGARRSKRSKPAPAPDYPPPCLEAMGCICAGHLRNPDPMTPCDATEEPALASVDEEREAGVCCTVCGGLEVQYAVWYRPNGGMQDFEAFGSWNAGDNTFCSDCDVNGRNPNPNLVDSGAEPEEYLNARSKRLGDGRGDTTIPPKYDAEGQRIDEHGNAIENDEGEI